MPSMKTNSTNDFNIENDSYKELNENDFENEENLIKCGEILLFKYNLLISCNYCEETLNNYELFTQHLFEKHLNCDLNQFKKENNDDNNEIKIEDNHIENNAILIYPPNELETVENYKQIDDIPDYTKLCYFNDFVDSTKTESVVEAMIYDKLYYSNDITYVAEDIPTEIHIQPSTIDNIAEDKVNIVEYKDNNVEDKDNIVEYKNNIVEYKNDISEDKEISDKKQIELQNKFIPMLGNSFKKNSETYEEKFYKYCKLFKEKEASVGHELLHQKNNINKTNSKHKQKSNENKKNVKNNDFIEEIPNSNIQIEQNNNDNVIFDDDFLNDLIEEDITSISFIENPSENIDIIEETVLFPQHDNNINNIVDQHIEIKHDNIIDEINIKNEVINDIKIEDILLAETSSIVKVEEDQIEIKKKLNQHKKKLTAISSKRNNFYHCPDCPRYYTRFETLKLHYRSHTGEKNPHTCLICNKSFTAPCKLIQHQRVHTGERPYKCTICPQAFKAKQKLKNHLESHKKGTIKKPSVYVDGISTFERQPACLPILINNKFITSSETKKDDGLFHCPICERRYRRFESLKEHADIHVEVKQYECHICNKRFTKIRSLKVHLKSHTPNKNIRWNGVPISCNYCEKTFNNKYYLNEHITVHSGKRPFECQVCKKRFAFRSNFVLHERTHSGDKRYQCTYCDMKFVQSTTKVRHERVVHLKEPPFTCRYCQKSFYTLSIYKKHIIDHKNNEILKENYDDEENGENIIANDNVEQTIIVDNNEENIIVVEPEDIKVNDFICAYCGAYFVDCGQYIEHCKIHDNSNEQNIVHFMEDDIVGSEEIIV